PKGPGGACHFMLSAFPPDKQPKSPPTTPAEHYSRAAERLSQILKLRSKTTAFPAVTGMWDKSTCAARAFRLVIGTSQRADRLTAGLLRETPGFFFTGEFFSLP